MPSTTRKKNTKQQSPKTYHCLLHTIPQHNLDLTGVIQTRQKGHRNHLQPTQLRISITHWLWEQYASPETELLAITVKTYQIGFANSQFRSNKTYQLEVTATPKVASSMTFLSASYSGRADVLKPPLDTTSRLYTALTTFSLMLYPGTLPIKKRCRNI